MFQFAGLILERRCGLARPDRSAGRMRCGDGASRTGAGSKTGRSGRFPFLWIAVFFVLGFWLTADVARAQQATPNRSLEVGGQEQSSGDAADQPNAAVSADSAPDFTDWLDADRMLSPAGLTSTLKILLLLTVLSLAPSILIMTTCFIRFVIVFGLLRQALGTQQLPPNQVLISLSLFLTFTVMAPVWHEAYEQGIRPYTQPAPGDSRPTLQAACQDTLRPLRRFMLDQIERTDNFDGVWMLMAYQNPELDVDQEITYDDVPLSVLLPAYMLSELKTAFIIGFQLYLPFLIIDMVISSVLVSMGMMMLPPVLISLPFKLLLFVLIDGWFLTVGMLLESVRVAAG